MKQLFSVLAFSTLIWLPSVVRAQLYPTNEAGVTLAAWHTIVREVDATKKFWLLFDGEPTKIDGVDVIKLPGVLVFLHPGEPTGPSAGAVLDHVAINCQNCFELIKRLRKAGYKTDEIDSRTMRSAREVAWTPRAWTYTYTPDGMRIEIETNPCSYSAVYANFAPTDPIAPCPERIPGFLSKFDPAGAIGSDQLHFYLKSLGEASQMQKFFRSMLGARSIRYNNPNVVIPGFIGVTALSETGKRPANKGRALDSVGLEAKNLEALCSKLGAAGIQFDEPYSMTRHPSYAHAAFTDPRGIQLQLTEGLAKFAASASPRFQLSPTEAKGKQLFDVYCGFCHSTTSADVQYDDAPGLLGEFQKPPHKLWKTGKGPDTGPGKGKELVVTEQSVRQIIMMGTEEDKGRMPAVGFTDGLNGQEVDALVAYLKTL